MLEVKLSHDVSVSNTKKDSRALEMKLVKHYSAEDKLAENY